LCSLSSRSFPHCSKKLASRLHGLGDWSHRGDNEHPLFFISDKITGVEFLIDTGASCSLFPVSHVALQDVKPCQTLGESLPTLGGGILRVQGTYHTHVDLGMSRLLPFQFSVATLDYGIIGADFLTSHSLLVNLAAKQLTESVEVERVSRHESISADNNFVTNSVEKTDDILLEAMVTEFPEVFNPTKRSRVIKHSIVASVETNTEEPVFARSRRLSPTMYRALQGEVKRLLDQGIIERSQSAWASPIVMVPKKNGSYRLCADFVSLNKVLKVQKHALPNINDFLALAHGCQWFSSLDVKDAYYNIPVRVEDRHKLTITCPLGSFCYNYLPMGLASSSAYYQRLMNEVVADIPHVFCYLDDIIIMTPDLDEHERILRILMQRLREHGLVLNREKCILAVRSLMFLGHRVTANGVSPAEAKVESIRNTELPRTKRQLRRYLGMYQFYAKFVKDYAKWLQPLYSLVASTPNNRALFWSESLEECFKSSKDALADAALLAFPDPAAATELVVDASAQFIGSVLQEVKDGVHKPLAFWSKALTKAQSQWSTFDRELYACYESIRHFRHYLDAKNFVLKTDHKPIVHRFHSNSEALTPRQQRHFDYIAQMTNKIEYVAGESNVADLPSRPKSRPQLHAILPNLSGGIDYLELAITQLRDPDLTNLWLNNTSSLVLERVPLAGHNLELLCDRSTGQLRPIIPKALRYKIFTHYHCLSHPGIKTTKSLIQRSPFKNNAPQYCSLRDCVPSSSWSVHSCLCRHYWAPWHESRL